MVPTLRHFLWVPCEQCCQIGLRESTEHRQCVQTVRRQSASRHLQSLGRDNTRPSTEKDIADTYDRPTYCLGRTAPRSSPTTCQTCIADYTMQSRIQSKYKLAPYGTDGRLLLTANFKVMQMVPIYKLKQGNQS